MQFAGKLLNRGDHARRRVINGVADNGQVMLTDGGEIPPDGPPLQFLRLFLAARSIGACEDEIFRLLAHHFFQAHLRPILRRLNHRFRACEAQGVSQERVRANRDKGILPYHK